MTAVDVNAPPFIPVHPVLKLGTAPNTVDISCPAESLEVSPDQDENTIETFCGSYTTYKPEKWTITASSFLSYGTAGLWNLLRPLVGTVVDFEVRPDDDVAAPGNPSMKGKAVVKAFPFFSGGPGEPTAVDIVLAVQGIPTWTTT